MYHMSHTHTHSLTIVGYFAAMDPFCMKIQSVFYGKLIQNNYSSENQECTFVNAFFHSKILCACDPQEPKCFLPSTSLLVPQELPVEQVCDNNYYTTYISLKLIFHC